MKGDPLIEFFEGNGENFGELIDEGEYIISANGDVNDSSDTDPCKYLVTSAVRKYGHTELPAWMNVQIGSHEVKIDSESQVWVDTVLQANPSVIDGNLRIRVQGGFTIVETYNNDCNFSAGFDPDNEDTTLTIVTNTNMGPTQSGECKQCRVG